MARARSTQAVSAAPKGRSVDDRTKWLEEDDDAHRLSDALREGVPSMRKYAREHIFMRPNPGEMEMVEVAGDKRSYSLYDLRVDRSDLPNPWAESIRATARLPFRSPITLEGWDTELAGKTDKNEKGKVTKREKGWVDKITSDGLTLDDYAAECFEDSLFDGIVYTFVDNDPRTFASPADRRAAQAQPRVAKLRRKDIRRITIEVRHDEPRLAQIVFIQPIPVLNITDPNNWTDDVILARKVVTAGDPDAATGSPERLVRTQIFVQNEKSAKWQEQVELRRSIVPDNPREEMLDIPLVPHYSQRNGPWRGTCAFLNTAWTAAAIWNHNSELVNLAREVSLTHVHESGVPSDRTTGKPILPDTRGARYHWSTLEGATMKVLEMQGTAVKTIRELIEWKTQVIEKAHHQLQTEKPTGPVTAREITLEGVRASSALEMWVIFQERAWQKILELMVLLGGLTKVGTASIPHDFGLPSSGMERNHQLFLGDKMSPQNYWPEAQRAGDVSESFDLSTELNWSDQKRATAAVIQGAAGDIDQIPPTASKGTDGGAGSGGEPPPGAPS